jgi:hypothetical protein
MHGMVNPGTTRIFGSCEARPASETFPGGILAEDASSGLPFSRRAPIKSELIRSAQCLA